MGAELATSSLLVAGFVALAAGFVSFASPCVLPLVPGFLGYVTGLSDVSLEKRKRSRLVLGALFFVLGFTAVFVVMALGFSALGTALQAHQELITRVGGVIVLLAGLLFLGVGRSLSFTPSWRPKAGIATAPVLGAIFAVGWSPCMGPTLGAIMAMAAPISASSGNPGRGALLAVIYSIGLGLPFIAMAALWERAGRASAWLGRHRRAIQTIGGLLLVVVGLLMVTGLWQSLMVWMQTHLIANFEVPL